MEGGEGIENIKEKKKIMTTNGDNNDHDRNQDHDQNGHDRVFSSNTRNVAIESSSSIVPSEMMNNETHPPCHQTAVVVDHQGDDGRHPHDDDGATGAAASGVVDARGDASPTTSQRAPTSDARPRFCGDCL